MEEKMCRMPPNGIPTKNEMPESESNSSIPPVSEGVNKSKSAIHLATTYRMSALFPASEISKLMCSPLSITQVPER